MVPPLVPILFNVRCSIPPLTVAEPIITIYIQILLTDLYLSLRKSTGIVASVLFLVSRPGVLIKKYSTLLESACSPVRSSKVKRIRLAQRREGHRTRCRARLRRRCPAAT